MTLYWQNETSGVLRRAIFAYLDGQELDSEQVLLIRDYLRLWIDQDVWADVDGVVAHLRASVRKIETWQDIDRWLKEALDVGIDPI